MICTLLGDVSVLCERDLATVGGGERERARPLTSSQIQVWKRISIRQVELQFHDFVFTLQVTLPGADPGFFLFCFFFNLIFFGGGVSD